MGRVGASVVVTRAFAQQLLETSLRPSLCLLLSVYPTPTPRARSYCYCYLYADRARDAWCMMHDGPPCLQRNRTYCGRDPEIPRGTAQRLEVSHAAGRTRHGHRGRADKGSCAACKPAVGLLVDPVKCASASAGAGAVPAVCPPAAPDESTLRHRLRGAGDIAICVGRARPVGVLAAAAPAICRIGLAARSRSCNVYSSRVRKRADSRAARVCRHEGIVVPGITIIRGASDASPCGGPSASSVAAGS